MIGTAELRLLHEGPYIAYGSYTLSDSAKTRRPLESLFSLSHTKLLLVFEGSFASAGGAGKRAFTLELELPEDQDGKGYFVFQSPALGEIKGVIGTTESGLFILAGRSDQPPTQLSAQLVVQDEYHLSLQGLLAFEDDKWVTWSASVRTHDSELANASVVSLPRRA